MPVFDKIQATAVLDDLLDAVRDNFNAADRATLYDRFFFMLQARHDNPDWEEPHASTMDRPHASR